MKKLLLIMFNIVLSFSLSTQNVDNIKQQVTGFQSQPDVYYFCMAEGKQRKETDQQALQELMSKIYIVVSSELTSITSENETGMLKIFNLKR